MYKASKKIFGNHGKKLAFDIEAHREIFYDEFVKEVNLLIFMLSNFYSLTLQIKF